jgi:hypothetical protein
MCSSDVELARVQLVDDPCQSTPVFTTLRFSTEVLLWRRLRASSATREMTLDLVGVVDLGVDGCFWPPIGDGLAAGNRPRR